MKLFAAYCQVFVFFCFKYAKGDPNPELVLSNDGPAVLGYNVTFAAELRNYDTHRHFVFLFDDGAQQSEVSVYNNSVTLERNFPSTLYSEGVHSMNVTVTTGLFRHTVAANTTRFRLSRMLVGEILVFRGSNSTLDADEVAVGENVTMTIQLHGVKLRNVEYGWSVDMETIRTPGNTLVYQFAGAGNVEVSAVATALTSSGEFLYGAFGRALTVKVPVNSVNVTGNPFLYHGDKLNLNISCNGTPPFVYCYSILKANMSSDNFTCAQRSSFTSCHFEILRYIQEDGKYNVGIYVSNDVHEVKRVLEVMVYSVSVNPTLSIVIIPMVFSLLALMIIAGGVAYCVQQRSQMAVEVANFDFQEESNSYTEKTFFESLFDRFACRTQSEEDLLIAPNYADA